MDANLSRVPVNHKLYVDVNYKLEKEKSADLQKVFELVDTNAKFLIDRYCKK